MWESGRASVTAKAGRAVYQWVKGAAQHHFGDEDRDEESEERSCRSDARSEESAESRVRSQAANQAKSALVIQQKQQTAVAVTEAEPFLALLSRILQGSSMLGPPIFSRSATRIFTHEDLDASSFADEHLEMQKDPASDVPGIVPKIERIKKAQVALRRRHFLTMRPMTVGCSH